jgi:UDP-N-acetylglucosamine acyltransferase
VTIEDRAFISGGVGVHQFCRIGAYAMVGGHAKIVQDVPPYLMVDNVTCCVCGLNLVGLRRNGFTTEQIAELKAAYRIIYRRGLKWSEVLEQLRANHPTGPAAAFHVFMSTGNRGFVQERRMPPQATLKLHSSDSADAPSNENDDSKSKAG